MQRRMIPRLLLFDVDGTLVVSRHKKVGNYLGSSLLEALSISFQQEIHRNGVHFAGGTDPSISADVLASYDINEQNCAKYHENIAAAFQMLPDIARKGVAEGRYNWKILPSVNEFLASLSKRDDVKIGLLTGNIQPVALIKLETAGVDTDYFMANGKDSLIGAFGCDSGNRNALVEVAKQRYREYLGVDSIDPNDVVVIGDTPKDIQCAHVNNSPCVAVTTGVYNKEELHEADCILENGFEDINASVKAVIETRLTKQGDSM